MLDCMALWSVCGTEGYTSVVDHNLCHNESRTNFLSIPCG